MYKNRVNGGHRIRTGGRRGSERKRWLSHQHARRGAQGRGFDWRGGRARVDTPCRHRTRLRRSDDLSPTTAEYYEVAWLKNRNSRSVVPRAIRFLERSICYGVGCAPTSSWRNDLVL
jgi:hypothetical protein